MLTASCYKKKQFMCLPSAGNCVLQSSGSIISNEKGEVKMKKIITMMVILSLCLSLAACGSGYDLSAFEKLVQAGDYTAAMEMYSNYADDYERQNAMAGVVKNTADQAIQNYLDDTMTYEDAKAQMDTVRRIAQDCAMLDEETLAGYDQQLTDANASKVAYDSAKELLADKNYRGAIEQFQKVAADDSRYADAQAQIETALNDYKEEVVAKAKQSADADKYDEADALISEGLSVLPEDTDLLTLQATYGKNYVAQIIEQADAALVKPGTDYEKAIEILRPAMQKYPEDASLTEKYDYYMQFQPVSIFDLESYTHDGGGLKIYDDEEDNMGNTYSLTFHTSDKASETFDIGKKYNLLKGTLCITDYSAGSKGKGELKIYGDDKLLFEKSVGGASKPQTVSVDITGVTDLKVALSCGDDIYHPVYVMFADVTLQKTAK